MDYDAHESERQMLLQEQRACRARAHKFSLETSRRRKALEDRQRQWDAQEQKIRENILQLRKQRMQDATERFQRAHVRPSQRRRPAFVKRAINIDEALNLLDARSTYAKPSALVGNTSMRRNSAPAPRPHTFPSSVLHQRESLTTEDNTKQNGQQKNHRTNQQLFLNDVQDAQGVLKEGQGIYPWEEHANLSSPTESLSSQDSLEIEELKQRRPLKSRGCFQSLPTEKDSLQSPETCSNGLHSLSPTVLHQTINRASEFLILPSAAVNYSEGHPLLRDELAEEMGSSHSLTPAIGHYNLKDLSQDTQEQATIGCHCLCAEMRMEDHLDSMSHSNCGKPIATAELHKEAVVSHHQKKPSVCPDSECLELACWDQECRTLSEQLKSPEEDQPEYPLNRQEEQTSSHICNQRHTNCNNPIYGVDDAFNRLSAPGSQTNNDVHSHQSKKPNTHADAINKEETIATLSQSVTKCPLSMPAEVRILKSILKKRSKYEAEETKYMYSSGNLIITKHMALSLRDSLEVMRGKKRESENDKTVKKKLRWFDEVNVENHTVNDMTDSALTKCKPRVTYQQGMSQAAGVHTEVVGSNSAAPSVPQCTLARQAWADVAAQDSTSQEQPPQEGPKTQRAFMCLCVPKVPRRARSARAGTGHAPTRVRKDTILRPQSATEASYMIRQQRKMIMPCPPPRLEVSDQKTAASSTKAANADEQKHSRSVHLVERTLYRPTQVGSPSDEGVAFAPCPPSYSCPSSDTLAKGRVASSKHGSHGRGRRCGAPCGEYGTICLNHTPTDDEISQLWNGVRSALSTKDDCVSQAQLTVPDDCVVGDVRSFGGMGGFYISPLHARRPVRRTSSDVNGSKKQMLVQQMTQMPGSGNRKVSALNQVPLMTITLPNKAQDQGPCQSMGPPLHTPILSLSGLSLEEQRVQQSLDRLNQRLQYVVGGNPSVKRLLHTEAPYHTMSAKLGETSSSGQRRLNTASNGH